MLLLAALGAVALVGAACGDDGSDGSSGDSTAVSEASGDEESDDTTTTDAPTTTAPLTFEQASDAYTACLESNGSGPEAIPEGMSLEDLTEMQDSSPAALAEAGVDRAIVTAHATCWPAFDAAMEAGATPPSAPTTTVDPARAAMLAQAVRCLNERGWDFLEPGVETGAMTMAARAADFNWDDPGFLADQEQCQRLAGMMG